MGLRNCLLYDKGHQHPISITMKAFIFLCLVAAAMAEADPQFLYNSYSSYYPSTYAYGGAYSPYTYGNFYGTRHFYKREAEAEADPALVYSTGVHGVHYPMTYGIHNYGYSHAAYPYTYGLHHYGKRDAEAEPQYVYSSGLTHYPMTYGIHHYGKRDAEAEPQYVYSSGLHYPYTYGLHNYGYTHYPYTTAYSHIFKREAEAEAEPQYYNNFYSRPYGYSRGYGYSSYRPYSYGGYRTYGGYRGYY